MSDVISSEPAWKELLKTTKIVDVIPKRPIVQAQYHEEVSTLLQRLSEANVLAAVVFEPNPRLGVLGFVDVLDLVFFVIETTHQSSKNITEETIQNIKWEGQCFDIEKTGTLMNISRADPLNKISSEASLWEAVSLLAMEVHRLAVVTPGTSEHLVSNIIAQSDIVQFLATRGVWIGSKIESPIGEIFGKHVGVATVLEDMNVVTALKYMRDFKVSGVGIVDRFGRLVANFSASDLLGLNATNFILLSLTVKGYLQRMHGFPKPPVYCTAMDTVETLLLKMVVHHVHRVYIVDMYMVPTGVVTMTDIMQFLVA